MNDPYRTDLVENPHTVFYPLICWELGRKARMMPLELTFALTLEEEATQWPS